jgi:hypothetical protein
VPRKLVLIAGSVKRLGEPEHRAAAAALDDGNHVVSRHQIDRGSIGGADEP